MRLLEAVTKQPESQDKTQNHQHCHYEDEDLCCFPNITHLYFFKAPFCTEGKTNNSGLQEPANLKTGVCFGLVVKIGLWFGSFSSFSHGEFIGAFGERGWTTVFIDLVGFWEFKGKEAVRVRGEHVKGS